MPFHRGPQQTACAQEISLRQGKKDPAEQLAKAKGSGRGKKLERAQSTQKQDVSKAMAQTRLKQGLVVSWLNPRPPAPGGPPAERRAGADDGLHGCHVQGRGPLHQRPRRQATLRARQPGQVPGASGAGQPGRQ